MKSRDINLDLIRAVAISFVILIHSKGTNIIYTAVPMFIMLSGALVLPKEEDYKSFYKKRLKRILLPFLIWSPIMYLVLSRTGRIDTPCVGNFFYLLSSTGVHGAYWYVYEILGLYLLAPFISKGVKVLDKKELLLLCSILLIGYEGFLFFPDFYFFQSIAWEKSKYLFFFLVGYFIVSNREQITKSKGVIIGSIIAVVAAGVVCSISESGFKALIPFASLGMFILLLSVPIKVAPPNLSKILSLNTIQTISKYSYGIYLTHPVFIGIFHHVTALMNIPRGLELLIILVMVLIANTLFFWIIDRFKFGKYLY